MASQFVITDPNENTFAIFGTPDCDPTMSGGKTARLKWNHRYTLTLSRRYVYCVHDPLDHNIDAIGISSTDVVAKLCVARAKLRF
jgi:hypothetical protein